MKVKIKEQEVELRYSMRALFQYENITGQSFNPKTLQDFCTSSIALCVVQTKTLTLPLMSLLMR